MRLLLIHTAGNEGSVALAEDGEVVAAEVLPGRIVLREIGACSAAADGVARLEPARSEGCGCCAWAGLVYRGSRGA